MILVMLKSISEWLFQVIEMKSPSASSFTEEALSFCLYAQSCVRLNPTIKPLMVLLIFVMDEFLCFWTPSARMALIL